MVAPIEPPFCLAPRYRLDDESPWLEGIDPSRHYWIMVNGDKNLTVVIPGLTVSSVDELKQILREFRSLQSGEGMTLTGIAISWTIHCISDNCYAVEGEISGAPVWHLFDHETLESLLRTAHPDWQCAPKDLELGRNLLMRSFQQAAAVKR